MGIYNDTSKYTRDSPVYISIYILLMEETFSVQITLKCKMLTSNPNIQLFVYPVYLADNKYGMRGVNYRGNITLIIGGPFGDRRERLQGLHRVGRQGDSCYRIFDITKDEIDLVENAKRKSALFTAKAEVL